MIGVGQLMVQTRNVLLTCQPFFFFINKNQVQPACLFIGTCTSLSCASMNLPGLVQLSRV